MNLVLILLILLKLITVDGDSCQCYCCSTKPCQIKLLENQFYVESCWKNGGRECLQTCIREYPNQCGTSSSIVIPKCQASSIDSFNLLIISFISLIYRVFIV